MIECLRQNAISTLPWPARSPDLNTLGHLWDILGRKIRKKHSSSADTTWTWGCIASGMAANPSEADTTPGPGYEEAYWCYLCSSRRLHEILKVLKLIVFDSANFGRHSCSNLTSLVAYRTILVTIWSFCQKKKKNAFKSTGLASQ